MAKYLLVYTGGSMAETPEAQEASMAAWGAWFGGLGEALADGGNPTSASMVVASNGSVSEGAPSGLSGYSLLTADSLAAAAEMAKGCPVLAFGGAVEVYETLDVM